MSIYYRDESVTLYHGDAVATLAEMESGSVDCIVTSPPYFGLRDYGIDGQIGAEPSPAEFVEALVAVFREARRVLADDGTLWLNLGDSYVSKPPGNVRGVSDSSGLNGAQTSKSYRARLTNGMGTKADTTKFGLPEKNLIGIPWRVAFALQQDGWTLRSEVIWHKTAGMPESVKDRPSRRHEHVFMFAKSPRYWFDIEAVRPEPAASASDVWGIPVQPFSEAHFAVMPSALAERCILASSRPGGTVLDPFSGSGTTGMAAAKHSRRYVGIDLNADYLDLSLKTRLQQPGLDFASLTQEPA